MDAEQSKAKETALQQDQLRHIQAVGKAWGYGEVTLYQDKTATANTDLSKRAPEPDCTQYLVGTEAYKQCECKRNPANCETLQVLYWYHSDHLGSSTYLTDSNGKAYQFALYLPFGESMADQKAATYSTPYKFNGKELDQETGLYYYGARYYDPRISLWYGVDPLAVYNPVMETEFYGDGQHNGGVFNHFNNNAYIYCYQNPIKYIDPNGKQTEWQKVLNSLSNVSTVNNVLKGKKWINYNDVGNCNDAAKQQNNQVKNSNPVGSGSQINMFIDKKRQDESGKKTPSKNFIKGLDYIISELKAGRPVMVGVMYERKNGADNETGGTVGDNNNVASNHYINIVGMGKDSGGAYYFSYYDNYGNNQVWNGEEWVNNSAKDQEKIGTNLTNNKLYIYQDSNGSPYISDVTSPPIEDYSHQFHGQNLDYVITEVRINQTTE